MHLKQWTRGAALSFALLVAATCAAACGAPGEVKTVTASNTLLQCSAGPLTGCVESQMGPYLASITGLVEQFYKEALPQLKPPKVSYIVKGATATVSDVCDWDWNADTKPAVFGYCRDAVVFGHDGLYRRYQEGPLYPLTLLATGFAQHAQIHAGIRNTSNDASVAQLSCIAGAFQKWIIARQKLGQLTRQWLSQPKSAHAADIQFGRDQGMEGCSRRYNSAAPLRNAR
jgi:hypothetical protein